jgi:endonuclease YncB( thermonuclease family)
MNQRVRAHVYRRDQYGRIVASVKIRRWFFRKDVGLEMIKSGLATVYEAKTGSEFGNLEQVYRDAEAKARLQRKGMWSSSSGKFESPRDYKTRMAAVEAAKATKGSAPKSTTGGFFSKLFGL